MHLLQNQIPKPKTSKPLPSPSILPTKNNVEFPLVSDSYLNNIANAKAMQFYYDHGAKVSARAFEVEPKDDATLMFCKHCIRFALGACPKQNKAVSKSAVPEPVDVLMSVANNAPDFLNNQQ